MRIAFCGGHLTPALAVLEGLREKDSRNCQSNKKAREVQNALPSNTKRGGSTGDSLEQAIAKFERTKELPDDFELRSKVLDSISSKGDITKPSWRR